MYARKQQEPRIHEYERNGVKVKSTWTPGGYMGSTTYEITGPREAIEAEIECVLNQWPPCGYGTNFNWPPGRTNGKGDPITHRAPTDHGDGIWTARGYHSNSSD
jgi:hypothetical protein